VNPNVMHPRKFSKNLHHANIVDAIREAEAKTSGQIRLLISPRHVEDAVAAAQKEFTRLRMDQAPERNGVLIFVAPRARKFAVIGDQAVHARCGDEFWKQLAEAMSGYFRQGDFSAGIAHGVQKAGELLAAHFPKKT
jgi:uncharacterized membrane protein